MSKEVMQMALDVLEADKDHTSYESGVCSTIAVLREALAQFEPEPVDMEAMAASVHDAYLTTCDALGWGVKPENRVPYSELTEDSKELDRASVRAVLRYKAPQRKEWVGLTYKEVKTFAAYPANITANLVRQIEAKLKEKNA